MAKTILQNCLGLTASTAGTSMAMDIVIARSSKFKSIIISDEIIDQPLSLLAHHDEEDLINLSATPLRPEDSSIVNIVPPTVIRIGDVDSADQHEFRYILKNSEKIGKNLKKS